ncbi:MAG: carboxypeptidase-like regulatory domain-containing protein [Bacteroidota bacterium]
MKRFLAGLLFLLAFSSVPFAQVKDKNKIPEIVELSPAEEEIFLDAEYFFSEGNYLRAVPLYLQLIDKYPQEAFFKYRAGICYLNVGAEKEKSIPYLTAADSMNHQLENISFYVGRAYHINYKFDEAIAWFNKFMTETTDGDNKVAASRYIEYCNNAKKLVEEEVEVVIDNLGAPVNTENREYVPVLSLDEKVLIFTYRGVKSTGGLQDLKFQPDPDGEYYEDIFISTKVDGKWTAPQPIGTSINTRQHDACIALSADGQKLFIFKSTSKDGGDIYMSRLDGTTWSSPVKLGKNVNTKYWEGSVSMTADEQTLYFASEKPGGYGGRDIYVSKMQPDGKWGKPENLGPTINTPFDDDAPYIHPDSKTLFFSTKGHNSMGGYDVMYAVKTDVGWTSPINLGYPVNGTEDDLYYVISADGERGYFSSNRKGGFGQQDIYTASPGFPGDKPVLAVVVGTITLDGKPVTGDIKVTDSETGENKGNFKSNSATGNYIIALTPGVNYKVAFEVEGQQKVEYVNVKKLETFVQVQNDVQFKTENGKVTAISDTSNTLQTKIETQLEKYKQQNAPELCEAKVYQRLLTEYGAVQKEGVSYIVELGTYESSADFNGEKIKNLGAIQSKANVLNHTTFSIGVFKTLLEAEQLKQKVLQADPSFTNAMVTIIDDGNRRLVKQYYKKEYQSEGCDTLSETKLIASKSGIVGLSDDKEYQQILKDNGTKKIEGLSFKVEICATKDTSSAEIMKLSKYGQIEKKTYPDGITRFTMGPFATLKEAEDFKKMLIEKEPNFSCSFVTVFYFGQRQTVKEFFGPCKADPSLDFAWFIDKDFNDTAVYNKLIRMGNGNFCVDGLIFKVQIGAYRFPQNFKYPQLAEFGAAEIIAYPDGITRFTMHQYSTLREAEAFRQQVIRKGITDAWITAVYKGERTWLTELVKVNFYNKGVN